MGRVNKLLTCPSRRSRSRIARSAALLAFAFLILAALPAGQALAYTPSAATAANKTAVEMAQDCNSPQYTYVTGTPAKLELPECTVLSPVSGAHMYTTTVTTPEDPNTTKPTFACSPGGATTDSEHSVTYSSGFDVAGFAIFGGVLGELLGAELAPEFGWSESNDVTDGTSQSVNVPWDSVGWMDASQEVGIGTFNVQAKYADGSTGTFQAKGQVPDSNATPLWTAQSRVMSEDEYHDFCNNTPTDVSFLNTLSPTSAGWYPSNGRLVNTVLNNMCLDDTNRSTSPGTQLQVWLCGGGSDGTGQQDNQTWTVQAQGGGWEIKNKLSQLCLDDWGSGTTAGTPVDQYTCNNTTAQLWYYNVYQGKVTPNGTPQDVYELQSAVNPNLCVVPSGTINGSPMVLGGCDDQAGVTPVFGSNAAASSISPGFTFTSATGNPAGTGAFVNSGTGRCLDDTNWSTAASTQMQIWDCTQGSNQTWTLASNGTIKNSYSGLCLDVAGNSATVSQTSPVAAIQVACNASDPAQKFTAKWSTFSGLPSGYQIVNDHGMCLDVHGDWSYNGNTADWYTCNHTGAQDWYLT
jgi:hypothetical protein